MFVSNDELFSNLSKIFEILLEPFQDEAVYSSALFREDWEMR